MQANPSNRWKNEAIKLTENHDFKYKDSYDAGRHFRKEDHQCDFCGTHLRYTAVIQAKDDSNVECKVGLDCIEHVFGTSWSRLQEVERDIKELKKEAKKKRRKKAYQEEYGKLIDWIEKYLDIKYNSFLKKMLHILKTGEEEFTRGMEDAIRDIVKETDFEQLNLEAKEQEREYERYKEKVEKVRNLIIDLDDIQFDDQSNVIKSSIPKSSSFDFVDSVYNFLSNRKFITDKQMNVLNKIYKEYKEKKADTAKSLS